MDEQDVWDCVGVVALGLVLAAVVWLLVSPSPGSGGQDQVRASERQVSGTARPSGPVQTPLSAHRRVLDQQRRCLDATGTRGVSGCVVATVEPPAPPRPTDRRAQRSTRAVAVAVASPPTAVAEPAAPPSVQPATQQPAAPQPSTPQPSNPPPAPTRQQPPPDGPVPGGNTTPPHPGPRP